MEPQPQPSIDYESAAVRKHVEITQGVIQRMAENSRSCKVWCVTLVSAVLFLGARTENPELALIALIPAGLFLILDAYYLALEHVFRDSYDAFVEKLHGGELSRCDIYAVAPTGMGLTRVLGSMGSVSIWLFYPLVAVAVALTWWVMSL